MIPLAGLDPQSDSPLYRQLYLQLRDLIQTGRLTHRLPATRELAGQLGLNRATISAAYELLEADGLIAGHVGRGSFVVRGGAWCSRVDWLQHMGPGAQAASPAAPAATLLANFSSSRPSELLFPLEEFRTTCAEVIAGGDAPSILQLGSPSGYPPLRRYLLERSLAEGVARPTDDILITSGIQQAFDLLQRVLVRKGETVLVEDPVHLGVRNVFERAGARLAGVPVGPSGMEPDALESVIAREHPALLVVTSSFQNPTGATMPLASRKALLRIARAAGVLVVENDIYGPLVYEGASEPTVKRLDDSGDTILLRSFSKIAFPGLRVGWMIAPRPLIERATDVKQWSDLHTDQLSQAVLLRFAESGRLEQHRERMLSAGRERLHAALAALQQNLPPGSEFTRPRGGMSLWVRLPAPLDAGELLARAEREGVSYLPGKYFAVSRVEPGSLRISFAGLSPEQIRAGMAILGRIFGEEWARVRGQARLAETPALV